jgi:hypothetical protein
MTSSQGYDQAPPGRDRVGALAGPPVFLASSAWVAVLAFATGWPLPSVVGRRAETIG